MPAEALRSVAKKAGKTLKKAEEYWNEAVKKLAGTTSGDLKFPSAEKDWSDRNWAYVMQIVKKRLGLKDSKIRDSALSDQVKELAEELKADDLYVSYYYRYGKFRRQALREVTITHTTEALRYFTDLKVSLDKVGELNADVKKDVYKVKEYIDRAIRVCISDDGVISSAEFDLFFKILHGIYEGMINYAGKNLTKDEWIFAELFGQYTAEKPFRMSILGEQNRYAVLKGLFSLGTHYSIMAEKLDNSIMDQTMSADIEQTAERFGQGLGGMCICPKCGHEVKHKRAEQCFKRKCPKCGATMTRKLAEQKLLNIVHKQMDKLMYVVREFKRTGDKELIDRLIF